MIDLQSIWCEKYRPQKLEDLIIDDDNRKIIEKIKIEENTPNLLFVGAPGTGKTSLAKIIVKDILQCQYLYINASDENGIDTIRTKVINFAQTKSLDGKVKVIILDESDGISGQGQQALRNVMETYLTNTRFILTANYKHKIIEPLRSRCQFLSLKPDIESAVKRCFNILRQENIEIGDDQKKRFVELVRSHFPDLRKTINELQKNVFDGKLHIKHLSIDNKFIESIFNYVINKDILKCREFYIQNESHFQSDYHSLLKSLLEYIYSYHMEDLKKKEMIAIIANHLYQSAFVVDQEINAFACLINMERVA